MRDTFEPCVFLLGRNTYNAIGLYCTVKPRIHDLKGLSNQIKSEVTVMNKLFLKRRGLLYVIL